MHKNPRQQQSQASWSFAWNQYYYNNEYYSSAKINISKNKTPRFVHHQKIDVLSVEKQFNRTLVHFRPSLDKNIVSLLLYLIWNDLNAYFPRNRNVFFCSFKRIQTFDRSCTCYDHLCTSSFYTSAIKPYLCLAPLNAPLCNKRDARQTVSASCWRRPIKK